MIAAARISIVIGFLLVAAFSCARAQQDTTISDKDVNVTDFADLAYPPIAATASVQGVVVVRVRLDDQGKVVDALAVSGSPLLISASVRNARRWRFEPNSQKAAIIVYNFRVEGMCPNDGASSHMVLYPPNLAAITACGRAARE
jgi:TonB family protein